LKDKKIISQKKEAKIIPKIDHKIKANEKSGKISLNLR
jgi:hypothetical protein